MNKLPKTLLLLGAAGGLAVPAAALGGTHATVSRNRAVLLKNIQIHPTTVRIKRGDTVTWTWGDKPIDAMHTVTSYGRSRFRSAGARFVGTYTVRFARKGTYSYHCTIHDNMMGRIVVR